MNISIPFQSNRTDSGPVTHGHFGRYLACAAATTLCLGSSSPILADDEEEFDEAHLFFELNDTDRDLGIHAKVDGGPWKWLKIEDTRERTMLFVMNRGHLRRQGLTEIFFESAEPTFDELPPNVFFKRFPAGKYEISGKSLEGDELENEVEISHVMPAPPQPMVNGESFAEECDDEEPGYDATEVSTPVTISWPAVTMSHPDADGGGAGVQPPVAVTIHNYELVVEAELEIDGEEFATAIHIVTPPDITELTIPDEFLGQTDEFKYEVLAREANYNQTATESCFVLEE